MTALPSLIVITDWSLGEDTLLQRLAQVLPLSPRIAVQHRHPDATGRDFLREARLLSGLCGRAGNPLFVNGRLDVALLVGAHLHLPAHGFRPAEVRGQLPEGALISAAVHDSREAQDAPGADLYLVSPVFGAGSKPEDTRTPLGVDGYKALALRLSAPAFALGGITAETAPRLPAAPGYAVISGVLRAADPRLAALKILARGQTLLA
ncbi:MAG: thiamine phosphate synthase [Myxococcota bacterium]|nr:thiamine phosphate synthase [Myxococcota bacterium]